MFRIYFIFLKSKIECARGRGEDLVIAAENVVTLLVLEYRTAKETVILKYGNIRSNTLILSARIPPRVLVGFYQKGRILFELLVKGILFIGGNGRTVMSDAGVFQ